jgi:HAD superfamily hydrolase (TIGR01662 family)
MATYERYEHAGQIPFEEWRLKGVEIPIFDKDNTLTSFHDNAFIPGVIDGLLANGLPDYYRQIALVSNSSDGAHIAKVAEDLSQDLDGITVFPLCQAEIGGRLARKPHTIMGEMVASHFNIRPDQLGVIGDRRFIDVKFGKKLGARAIALCDKVGEGDQKGVPTLRVIEGVVVSFEERLGIAANRRQTSVE